MERAEVSDYRARGLGLSDFIKLASLLLVAGIFSLNLAVVRPLKQRLDSLQKELVAIQGQMELLVSERDHVRNTNDLLSLLSAQRSHIQDSYAAVKSFREFRAEVEAEVAKTNDAMASLGQLAELEKLLVEQQRYAGPAARVLEDSVSMQRLLAERIYDVEEAEQVLQRMLDIQQNLVGEADNTERARTELERLTGLKRRILSQSRTTEQAQKGLANVNGLLANLVQETDDVEPAQSAAIALLDLKDRLVVRGMGIPLARNHTEQLLDMRDRLLITPSRSEIAGQSLEQLLEMQSKLISVEESNIQVSRDKSTTFALREAVTRGLATYGISIPKVADFVIASIPSIRPFLRAEFWDGKEQQGHPAAKEFRSAIRPAETIPQRKRSDRTSQRQDLFGPRHYAPLEGDSTFEDPSRLIWPAGT